MVSTEDKSNRKPHLSCSRLIKRLGSNTLHLVLWVIGSPGLTRSNQVGPPPLARRVPLLPSLQLLTSNRASKPKQKPGQERPGEAVRWGQHWAVPWGAQY